MAQMLRDRGREAWAIAGGLAAWRRAGLALEPKDVEMDRTPAAICPLCHRPMSEHVV